jgi:hypothetical protein
MRPCVRAVEELATIRLNSMGVEVDGRTQSPDRSEDNSASAWSRGQQSPDQLVEEPITSVLSVSLTCTFILATVDK